jgi:hypothetical protein
MLQSLAGPAIANLSVAKTWGLQNGHDNPIKEIIEAKKIAKSRYNSYKRLNPKEFEVRKYNKWLYSFTSDLIWFEKNQIIDKTRQFSKERSKL